MGHRVLCKRSCGLKTGRVERELRAVKVRCLLGIDEVLHLAFPVAAQRVGPFLFAFLLECADQLGDEGFVHGPDLVGRPFLDLIRDCPIGDRGSIGALQVLPGVEVLDLLGIELGNQIHSIVKHDDVRIVVDSP